MYIRKQQLYIHRYQLPSTLVSVYVCACVCVSQYCRKHLAARDIYIYTRLVVMHSYAAPAPRRRDKTRATNPYLRESKEGRLLLGRSSESNLQMRSAYFSRVYICIYISALYIAPRCMRVNPFSGFSELCLSQLSTSYLQGIDVFGVPPFLTIGGMDSHGIASVLRALVAVVVSRYIHITQ